MLKEMHSFIAAARIGQQGYDFGISYTLFQFRGTGKRCLVPRL